jgi:hypothetical protein
MYYPLPDIYNFSIFHILEFLIILQFKNYCYIINVIIINLLEELESFVLQPILQELS